MAHDRGCEITEIQPHMVTIERKERNSILLVQHMLIWHQVYVNCLVLFSGAYSPCS
jgi:hypothetical protein